MCLTSLKIIKIWILKNNCFKIAKQHFPVCVPSVCVAQPLLLVSPELIIRHPEVARWLVSVPKQCEIHQTSTVCKTYPTPLYT